ncbi:Alcohol dehydrogenase 1 [Dendrobium catenatum]|uniref:Alcohol dehydrogenase 1 n=1 Tax=Dendrobium catenatum TaxID=906689 RepID=A0A2I0X6V7_9ASPA|nr:Alcohol dehydrogenase 1 [Dendrobium catenatum]
MRPLIESSFDGFEDPLPKSSSLPLCYESVYDVYEDNIFGGVLGVDTPMNNDDKSTPNVQPELFAYNVSKVTEKVEVASPKAMEVRVKIKYASLCLTDLYFGRLRTGLPYFPAFSTTKPPELFHSYGVCDKSSQVIFGEGLGREPRCGEPFSVTSATDHIMSCCRLAQTSYN